MTEHTPTAEVEHLADCPGARIVRRETPRKAHLTCTGCGAWASTPRRTEWQGPADG